jgi:hypothetical protein
MRYSLRPRVRLVLQIVSPLHQYAEVSYLDFHRTHERNGELKSIVIHAEDEAQSLESRPLLFRISRAPQAGTGKNVEHWASCRAPLVLLFLS